MVYVVAITRTVVVGLIVLPSFVLAILSLTIAKIHGDPARQWICLLRMAMAFMALGSLFFTVVGTLHLSVTGLELLPYDIWGIVNTTLTLLTTLFLLTTHILIFSTFVDLAVAVSLVRNGPVSEPKRTARNIAHAFSVLLLILAMIAFAIYMEVTIANDTTLAKAVIRLNSAITVLLLVVGILAVAMAIAVMVQANHPQQAHQAAIFLLVCTILNLIPHCFEVAYLSQYGGFGGPALNYVEAWLSILTPILAWWPPFILLTIMFSLAIKENDGIWTIHPPMSQYDQYQQYAYQPQPQQQWYEATEQEEHSPFGYNEPYQPNTVEWQQPVSPSRPSPYAAQPQTYSTAQTWVPPGSPPAQARHMELK